MAWVARSDRFSPSAAHSGPGAYIGPATYNVEPNCAPFGSTKARISGAPQVKDLGPPPGAYDPKLPQAYDAGLPRKTVPFTTGAPRDGDPGAKGPAPGPGAYYAEKRAQVLPCRTMGMPQMLQQASFRSTSAPSIPRNHQCFGYDETGDGRLIRQGPKDGKCYLSGRVEDSAGPGHYDAHVVEATANRPRGGRFLQAPLRGGVGPSQSIETPGPGHYVAKDAKDQGIVSSFVSSTERGCMKLSKSCPDLPGPGQYSTGHSRRPTLREQHPEMQYFGSTSERFKNTSENEGPGPGTYVARQRVTLKPSWNTEGRFQLAPDHATPEPGPGEYNPAVGTAQTATASLLGSTGRLAFGSMESRGRTLKNDTAPGPGAYEASGGGDSPGGPTESDASERRGRPLRAPKPPSSTFQSGTARDAMTQQLVKEGQCRPPPGAYNPIHAQDMAAVMRFPPKSEGFLSAGPRTMDLRKATAPGPGRYDPGDITGGKRIGSFNRAMVEGAPSCGRTKGLGFDCQARRFKTDSKAELCPGPGAYSTDPQWITKTHNINFGDFV